MDFDKLMAGEPVEQECSQETVEEQDTPETVEEAVTEEPVQETVQPEPSPEPKETTVPLAALMSERDKARQHQSEVEQLRRQIADMQSKQQQSSNADPYDNPDEFRNQILAQARADMAREYEMKNFEASRQRALTKYGQAEIDSVAEWAGQYAQNNPQFERELMSQPDPAEWVIGLKKRNDEMQLFTTDREAFIRAEAAKLGLAAVAPVEDRHTDQPTKKPQPASINNAKSRDVASRPTTQKESFDDLMKF